jgi:Protein of unknown function (DUF3618)
MAQASDQIRGDIEDTRERLGETVDALAYKANVPERTKNWLGEKKDAVTSAVGGHTPDGREVKQHARGLKRTAERNPLGLAIAGAAAGFLAGLLTPSTRVEDERIGPMADEVKSTAADAGREALERGKEVARESGQAAVDTAKERGREESQELSSSLQDKAHEAAGSTTETSPETTPTTRSRSV